MNIEETRFFTVAAPDEFLAGMRDCRDGKPHAEGRHPDYDRGYAMCLDAIDDYTAETKQASPYRSRQHEQ